MKANKFISFGDGIVSLFSIENVAEKGDAIKEKLILYNKYRFSAKTVGMNRYFMAMQNNVEINLTIRIPTTDLKISTQLVAVINNIQYRILQVQKITSDKPHHLLLTLSELEEYYDFKGI